MHQNSLLNRMISFYTETARTGKQEGRLGREGEQSSCEESLMRNFGDTVAQGKWGELHG